MVKDVKSPKAIQEPKAKDEKLTMAILQKAHNDLTVDLKQFMLGVDEMISQIELLRKEVNELRASGGKNRGPKSTRDMNEEDARRVKFGDLKRMTIKKAASALGLSYGQVYSARNGYTFKDLGEVPRKEGEN